MLERASAANAPYVLALDLATVTGVCEGRAGEIPRFYSQRFGKDGDEHEDAFERGLRWIVERFKVGGVDAVFIEAAINPGAFVGEYDKERGKVKMTTNPETTIRLMGLWAIMAAAARVKRIRYRRVHVQTARKAFIGHGNLRGPEAKRRCFEMSKLLGWAPNTRDESDAACIWTFGVTQMAPNLAPIITPMMQSRIATTVAGVQIDDPSSLFKKAGVRS